MGTLGCGVNHAFLFDRGGRVRVAEFDGIEKITWTRELGDISTAEVVISLAPEVPECCDWLGNIRSMRNELVVFRDNGAGKVERVWEGPITRVLYDDQKVTVQARDVLFWTDRRVHRGYFTDPMNGVTLMNTLVGHAFTYDDPNVLAFRNAIGKGAPVDVKSAINRADQTYFDALQDLFDQGISFTANGRSICMWSSNRQLSRTERLVSGTDLSGVQVVDDGESLATRVVVNGGDTFGATTPEPVVVNYARNPSVEASISGFSPGNSKFYTVDRISSSAVGRGSFAGRVYPKPPSKPAENASNKAQRVYNQTLAAFESTEVPMAMLGQRLSVHEGEQVSAQLTVRQRGNARCILGLRLRGMLDGEVDDDRAFVEGTPRRMKADTNITLTVTGTVPAETDQCFVEVFRDTKVKWQGDDGFFFDQFAIWRGRLETWFDGSVPDTSRYTYSWDGGPNASTSRRTYYNPKVDGYYGLVELLNDSDQRTRTALEAEARSQRARAYPAPLVIVVPEKQPLLATTPIEINELVAGATIPVSTTITCRQAQADTILHSLEVTEDKDGEQVLVTLEAGQTWDWDYSIAEVTETGVGSRLAVIDEEGMFFDPPPERRAINRDLGDATGGANGE